MFTNINITPLTDIALVLLVIFMIATPMLIQSRIKVNLPKVATKNRITENEILAIFVDKQGKVFINDKEVLSNDLPEFFRNFARKSGEKSVTLNGDLNVKYDSVVQVLNLLHENGLDKIALGVEVK